MSVFSNQLNGKSLSFTNDLDCGWRTNPNSSLVLIAALETWAITDVNDTTLAAAISEVLDTKLIGLARMLTSTEAATVESLTAMMLDVADTPQLPAVITLSDDDTASMLIVSDIAMLCE